MGGCNLGYGQDAVNACLLTQCHFQACRFPFLESDSPVANFSGSNFVACRIQWSGQFPHEESFVINSYWLRKWNLANATVSENTAMGPNYYDNRYWSLYKLPMFGCTDPNEVIREIEACKREFPNAKVRVIAFDSKRQVQTAGFIVRK